jgi:hypothetical protein
MPYSRKSTFVALDDRHAVEQDALGQPRFLPGEYEPVEIVACTAVAGDPNIWVPEVDVTYFIVAARVIASDSPMPLGTVAHWVNRLRFRGPHQLKEFLVEATGVPGKEHHRITADVVEFVVSAENPLAGVKLRLKVEDPKPSGYLHHVWKRV